MGWSDRTLKKNHDGYGRYLSWLHRKGLLIADEEMGSRVTPPRVAAYVAELKGDVSPVSVATMVGSLTSAVRALAPEADWSWLSRKATRLKLKAKPSRDKRGAIRHTQELYQFGKRVMNDADPRNLRNVPAAQRYQSGLIIALLAARPLRIRNFQAITLGRSLRWDGRHYWLTFDQDETKTGTPIDEPLPNDLVPHLETYLRRWRPVLIRQATKFGGDPAHRRLWVDIRGAPMEENTLRELVKRYTRREFGVHLWPHLFRDCLLTSLATDQPDLMGVSAALLGHSSGQTGEKHYNQARMLDAGRRFATAVSDLRAALLNPPERDCAERV